ncbi:CYTH domain-containing protein [Thalassotalea euphylliae]|uniref:CYTH domain-containing protein n=1 Tax=Thalassotalea euphylliae TaxID=1655234 RepID=A0A3E0TTF1_9GAMM|nr:CYTH and CHAD domain-containing protein [Thalassotalea euphylliae]REL27961.1 CYTH domain-containing protein [Thalassotalea euphylliae]
MSTEIELKYLIDGGDVVSQFTQLLNQRQYTYTQAARQLSNTYFDTSDRMLRQYDFGLRVRKADDYTEQTIKTAGIVVGGLHQRPEYNVAIDDSTPELALFPADIWPTTTDVEQLQANLQAIFSTNFYRTTWQVNVGDSVVEVAFDQGIIESKGHSKGQSKGQILPINEIELELVSGERQAIFTLAKELCQAFTVTPGRQSKAARGYLLWQGAIHRSTTDEISFQVPLNPELSVEKAMVLGFEHGLSCLQQAIGQSLAAAELTHVKQVFEALSFIQQGLYLHQNLIASTTFNLLESLLKESLESLSWLETAIHINDLTLKSGNYRKKLEYSNQLVSTLKIERSQFPSEEVIQHELMSAKFNLLQLHLLQFILDPVVKPVEKTRSLTEHAKTKLSNNLTAIKEICGNKMQLSAQEYLVIQQHLFSSLHTGSWFGALYEQSSRTEYRRTWLDVFHGIEELATLNLLQQQLNAIEQSSQKLNRWLNTKVDNLLQVINQSYQAAVKVEPYWL